MAYARLCLTLVFLVSVLTGLEISKEVEETIHIKYRADTVLRYEKHHERRGGPRFIGKSLIRDSGHVKNCAKGTKSKMDISWSPEVINIKGDVTVDVDAVLSVNVMNVTALVNFYLPGNTDPFATIPRNSTCDKMKQLLPTFIEQCPIKAGKEIKVKETFNLAPLADKIPEGTFIIVAEAKNENGKEIFCMNATVTTVSDGF